MIKKLICYETGMDMGELNINIHFSKVYNKKTSKYGQSRQQWTI